MNRAETIIRRQGYWVSMLLVAICTTYCGKATFSSGAKNDAAAPKPEATVQKDGLAAGSNTIEGQDIASADAAAVSGPESTTDAGITPPPSGLPPVGDPTQPFDPVGTCGLNDLGTVNLFFPPDIDRCMKQGSIYNFETRQCSQSVAAKPTAEFTCDFNNLLEKMASYGISRPNLELIDADRQKGAQMVACSLKDDGATIIAQYWRITDTANRSCDTAGKEFMTVCYRYGAGANPTSPEERAAFVQDCLARP